MPTPGLKPPAITVEARYDEHGIRHVWGYLRTTPLYDRADENGHRMYEVYYCQHCLAEFWKGVPPR